LTPETYLQWAAAIDRMEDGTAKRGLICGALHLELLHDPENFPVAFFETVDGFRDDPLREVAKRLLSSGTTITLADIEAELGVHLVRPE